MSNTNKPKPSKEPMIHIGIDPGVTTGIAEWRNKKLSFHSFRFWKAVDWIEHQVSCWHQNGEYNKVSMWIEDPHQIRGLYDRYHSIKELKKLLRIAQNVGMNKMIGTLLIEKCRNLGLLVHAVKPHAKNLSQLTPEVFYSITKCHCKCPHARAAAMLVYGR
jgi:hypothetical protein